MLKQYLKPMINSYGTEEICEVIYHIQTQYSTPTLYFHEVSSSQTQAMLYNQEEGQSVTNTPSKIYRIT